jgi:hypothetical protein
MKIAVACHEIAPNGGLLRFERFGRVARSRGHELAFVCFSHAPQAGRPTEFPVLSLEEAKQQSWDATMVPGAGFPIETIERFSDLQQTKFGHRIQHVLNDRTRLPGFLQVNAAFRPQTVIFNNRHWAPGTFTEFMADEFHVLEGAVDTRLFAPRRYKGLPSSAEPFLIGGQAPKNPLPLIEAVRQLDARVELRLFGAPGNLAEIAADLVQDGRLRLTGPLDELGMIRFYDDLDCIVHAEEFAGWANMGAEALACGVPLICTTAGTLAFAEHEQTALVLPEPSPGAILSTLDRLRSDPDLVRGLSSRGRARILDFSWEDYTTELLNLVGGEVRRSYYTWAPEIGLFGKWPISKRIAGLAPVFDACRDKTVLDLGAAEGMIALTCLQRGAAMVHGFDIDPARVASANAACGASGRAVFCQANLADWAEFTATYGSRLLPDYDIVLYLGLHHHLPAATRLATLRSAAGIARQHLAVRMPEPLFQHDHVRDVLLACGFSEMTNSMVEGEANMGAVRIFHRHS